MTTLMKRTFAGLLILAGAPAILTQVAWREGQQTDDLHPALLPVPGRSQHRGSMSAFALDEPFLRQGAARPRQAPAGASRVSNIWSFLPQPDSFRADALLDLRGLNEPIAGQSGFIRLSPDKNGFVRGDGVPVRFWAVNFSFARDLTLKDVAHAARFLAKRGVNLIRLGGSLESHAKNPKLTDADPEKIDQVWRLVAAMKQEGIYTLISPYWSVELKRVPASWGIEGWPEDQSPVGLLFFNPRLQEGYKAWLKAQLTPPNPYTGIPLAKDPALAMIQIQNEDSLLFWTEQGIKGKQLELLGKQFGDWTKAKYGTLQAALRHWDGGGLPEDDPARCAGHPHRLAVHPAPFRRLQEAARRPAPILRRDDVPLQRRDRPLPARGPGLQAIDQRGQLEDGRFHPAQRRRALVVHGQRGARGQQLLQPGPPRPRPWLADQQRRPVRERVGPVQPTGPAAGPQAGGRVSDDGHRDALGTALGLPVGGAVLGGGLPVADRRGRRVLERDQRYRVVEPGPRPVGLGLARKWSIATPMMLGQFPAAALLFRRGDVTSGHPAVVEHRSLEQLWGRVPPIIAEEPDYDPNRDRGDTARRSQLAGGVDPLAFLVGPVQVVYGSDPAKTTVADLSRYIDREKKVVRSDTGQLAWDYGRGLCTLDAPRAQGVTGFLRPVGSIKLGDVTIRSENQYATVLVVSLDGTPLAPAVACWSRSVPGPGLPGGPITR